MIAEAPTAVERLAEEGSSGAKTYPVKEYAYAEVPLSDLMEGNRLQVDKSVVKNDYFTLQLRGDRLQLQARGFVGLIPLNDRVVIDVRPRVRVANFTRLLEVAGETPTVLADVSRRYRREADWSDSLLDLYGRALVAELREIQLRGLFREYHRREESTSFPRGRILLGRTATQFASRGVKHVAATSWFERTSDNPCNQCMKYATWFLGQRYSRLQTRGLDTREIHRGLSVLYGLFDGVRLDLSHSFLNDPLVSGQERLPTLRSYYRPALDIALAIINQHAVSIDRPGDDLRLPSLILKMSTVFEAYVRSVLRRQSKAEGWGVEVLDGRHDPPRGGRKLLFDRRPSNRATPDVVLRVPETQHQYPALLEVKYKPAEGDPDRDALNQAITYAASYRSNEVLVVQPRASATSPAGLNTLGTIDQLSVHQYVFDLDADDLAAEEVAFASAVRNMAGL